MPKECSNKEANLEEASKRMITIHRHFRFSAMAILGILAVVVIGSSSTSASPIAVANFSFESPDVADQGTSGTLTSWTSTGSGIYDPQNAQFAGTNGNNANTSGALPNGGQVGIITEYFNGVLGGNMSQ